MIALSAGPLAGWDETVPELPEIRDEHVLAQPRLTLPALAPATVPQGSWQVRLGSAWSSSFSWRQDLVGEEPNRRDYLMDGETLTLDASVRRGLTASLDVDLRVPLRWRGGGQLDEIIDGWHRDFGLPANNRPDFRQDAFRVEGRTSEDGGWFSWNERAGWGFGDLELSGRWRMSDPARDLVSVALVGRVSLPTASAPFDGNGAGGAAQLVMTTTLGSRFTLHGGFGASVQDPGPVHGVLYEKTRIQGFVAISWRPSQRIGFVAETNAASRLVSNVEEYPGVHWILNTSGWLAITPRLRLELGFTENFIDQDSTTDFGLHLGLVVRP